MLAINLDRPERSAQQLFDDGMEEFQGSNYGAASDLFRRAYRDYTAAGDDHAAREAQDMRFRCDRVLFEYSLTREQAEAKLAHSYPFIAESERNAWLDGPEVESIISDGRELFYYSVAENIAYRNLTLFQSMVDQYSPSALKLMMDSVMAADASASNTYFAPVDYIAEGTLNISRDKLPSTGNLSIYLPAPIRTASQVDVTVSSVQPQAWVRSMSTDGDLGQVYMEVPLENLTGDLAVEVTYTLTTYQKHFDIDPSAVTEYDRTSDDYVKYTASQESIRITPEITAEARAVVGNESNPYLQARMLYDYVIGNISYSFTPHLTVGALGIGESEYVRTHRYGDCGAQSQYFCALLRSLGIPARSVGGYQTFGGGTGTHMWAEFLLPGYGWVPVDVTAAESMDWIPSTQVTEGERSEYKAYYFGNLDSMRYVIQNDADIALTPEPAQSNPTPIVFQNAILSCATSEEDLPLMAELNWKFIIIAVP